MFTSCLLWVVCSGQPLVSRTATTNASFFSITIFSIYQIFTTAEEMISPTRFLLTSGPRIDRFCQEIIIFMRRMINKQCSQLNNSISTTWKCNFCRYTYDRCYLFAILKLLRIVDKSRCVLISSSGIWFAFWASIWWGMLKNVFFEKLLYSETPSNSVQTNLGEHGPEKWELETKKNLMPNRLKRHCIWVKNSKSVTKPKKF